MSQSTYYTPVNSKDIRNIFTVTFIVLQWLVGFSGAALLKRRNQASLLKENPKAVPLSHLSSWLSDVETLKYLWQTRRLPGGRYGLLMLLTGAFALTSHIFVGRYINTISIPGRCDFNSGVVVQPPFTNPNVPQSQWPAANVAFDAYLNSNYSNGGLGGVYYRSNTDTNFTAAESDVIGGWVCSANGPNQTYLTNSTGRHVIEDLQSKGFLYNASLDYVQRVHVNGPASADLGDLMILSANISNTTRQPWDLKASVGFDFEASENSLSNATRKITMSNYYCKLPTHNLDWLLETIPTQETLTEWKERSFGFLIASGSYGPPSDVLEMILDVMTMAAGSGNSDEMTAAMGIKPTSTTYGCLTPWTAIDIELFIALAFLLLIFLPLVFANLIMLCIIRFRRKRNPAQDAKVEDIPQDLMSWQVATLRHIFNNESLGPRDTARHTFGWLEGGRRVGYTENGNAKVMNSLSCLLMAYT